MEGLEHQTAGLSALQREAEERYVGLTGLLGCNKQEMHEEFYWETS